MPQELKTFEAVFAERTEQEWRIVTVAFRTERESDALEIAKDLALLNGSELVGLFRGQNVIQDAATFHLCCGLQHNRQRFDAGCYSLVLRRNWFQPQ
jgi:hypothetical protein